MPVLAMHLLGNCRISCRNTSLFYTASETALTITALLSKCVFATFSATDSVCAYNHFNGNKFLKFEREKM